MVDTTLDDVKELIRMDQGDPEILQRIKRAAEQDEVISVYERDYIRKLAERYIRPKFEEPQEMVKRSTPVPAILQTHALPVKKQSLMELIFGSRTKKIILGIILLGLIAGGGAYYVGSSDAPISVGPRPGVTSALTVEADVPSYSTGDIVAVSGTARGSGDVTLSITNTGGDVIWQEKIAPKSGGAYSTLLIAGGAGWESAGRYTLSASQGSLAEESSFAFRG